MMGRHEILDGDAPENVWDSNYERYQKHPRPLTWTGPYQPGGNDAVDVVDLSWPIEKHNIAMKRLQAFSENDHAKRRAYQQQGKCWFIPKPRRK